MPGPSAGPILTRVQHENPIDHRRLGPGTHPLRTGRRHRCAGAYGRGQGVVAPAGTPPAVVDKLNREINRIRAMPDVAEKLVQTGLEASPMTPAAYGEFIRREIAQYARVIQNAKIKLD